MNPSDPYFWEWMVLELQVCLNTCILIIAIGLRWGQAQKEEGIHSE